MNKKLEDTMPIYMQIMDRIKEAIAAGELKAGQRVPPVRDLAKDFSVNPNTMQRALIELEREGLLAAERTSGRFVTEDGEKITSLRDKMAGNCLDSFIDQMSSLGFNQEEMITLLQERCVKNMKCIYVKGGV